MKGNASFEVLWMMSRMILMYKMLWRALTSNDEEVEIAGDAQVENSWVKWKRFEHTLCGTELF